MELIETPTFTRLVSATWSDEEYRLFQLFLVLHPAAGALVPGTRGLRKVRWAIPGHGKRGGVRVIYYWKSATDQLYLLYLFAKNARADLSRAELQALRALLPPTP